ncbi:MAG: hypothetical protein AAF907_04620 [Planctomycetota bacterium]
MQSELAGWAFAIGQSLPWVLLYGIATVFALRMSGRHGAGWAVGGFGLLTACAVARLGLGIWQAVAVRHQGPTALGETLTLINLFHMVFSLLALVGHGAVVVALVKAWRSADRTPIDELPDSPV